MKAVVSRAMRVEFSIPFMTGCLALGVAVWGTKADWPVGLRNWVVVGMVVLSSLLRVSLHDYSRER